METRSKEGLKQPAVDEVIHKDLLLLKQLNLNANLLIFVELKIFKDKSYEPERQLVISLSSSPTRLKGQATYIRSTRKFAT